ncbi:MAG: dUTP diphosphatase [Armatimonadia bacterium]
MAKKKEDRPAQEELDQNKYCPQVKVKRLCPEAKLPTRNHDAAGLDLFVTSICPVSGSSGTVLDGHKEVVCQANRVYKACTGIAVEPPTGYFGMIKPRSGLSLKNGLMVGGGVVDADFRGEVAVIFTVENALTIRAGDRIAQLVLLPYLDVAVVEAEELSETKRGEQGYGSSGK